MKKTVPVLLMATLLIPTVWAGESKVRASAQSRVSRVAAPDSQAVATIDQLLVSGEFSGRHGIEKYLARAEKSLDRNLSQMAASLKDVSEASLRETLQGVWKAASDAGNTALMNKVDRLLAPSEVSLKDRLIQSESKETKDKILASLKDQIQQAGSVTKLLIQQREKLMDRSLEESSGSNRGKVKNPFMFPVFNGWVMEERNHREFGVVAAWYIFLGVPVAIDLVLLPVAGIAEIIYFAWQ